MNVNLGIWHYIPLPLQYDLNSDSQRSIKEHFEKFFPAQRDNKLSANNNNNNNIIIYIHGSAGDRSGAARIQLCQNLAQLGYHVFAIDVRGYGDSTGWPTETGVVKDTLAIYNNLKTFITLNSKQKPNIYLYGHSLGAAIALHAAKILSHLHDSLPAGIILESPFKNVTQGTLDYAWCPLILNNPWIIDQIRYNFDHVKLSFANDEHIAVLRVKTLLYHAEDDGEMPFTHSKELAHICRTSRPKDWPTCEYHLFEKSLGLGHSAIYTHKRVYSIIKNFIEAKHES
jgi:abhydrolase domain-containing protein 12